MTKLSIVVPVYNESAHLKDLFPHLMKVSFPISVEWIFVDDCSTDGSFSILEELSQAYSFRLFRLDRNRGKGAAIQKGVKESQGDLILIQDADFEYDPTDIPQLLEPLLENRADVVYGSRFKKSVRQVHRTYHYFVNSTLTFLSNLLSGVYLTDMETCYKVFRADLLKAMNLQSNRFGFEVEVTAYVAKTRARIYELPISYYPRTRLQGKKITWKDGVAALRHLIYFNWIRKFEEAFDSLPHHYDPKSPGYPRGDQSDRPRSNGSDAERFSKESIVSDSL